MLAQRIAQQSLRRLAANPQAANLFAAPAAIATGKLVQRRQVAAQAVSGTKANDEILAKQRLNRPIAPHLSIYRPQITWYASAFNRITGCALSGAFYVFGAGYLIGPYLGLHMESAVLAAGFAAWPFALTFATKLVAAVPFTFHCLNGLRHLTWDTASMITNKKVNQTGWFVVGLTAVSSIWLALL